MKIVIDFETKDFGIDNDLGPGWPWGGVTIIGMSWSQILSDDGNYTTPVYETDVEKMKEVISKAETVIAHNALYEAGILKMWGFDMSKIEFLCTKIGAKLFDNSLEDFSLDGLSGRYLGGSKAVTPMIEDGIELGLLVPTKSYYAENQQSELCKRAKKKLKNSIMENLDRLQLRSPLVKEYCNHDVQLTCELYFIFKQNMQVWKHFSKMVNVFTDVRSAGIRVDTKNIYKTLGATHARLIEAEKNLWESEGHFNYASPKQIAEWAESKGLSPVKDIKGKEGYGKLFLEKYADREDIKLLKECKRWVKAKEFAESLAKFEKGGRIYPEFDILGARTGRFVCRNPNFQQIPSRDTTIMKLIRSCFLPEEGEKWISLDYSTQEPRIALHLATLLQKSGKDIEYFQFDEKTETYKKCKTQVRAEDVRVQLDKWLNDATEDAYQPTVDYLKSKGISITRTQVKAIVLGIMYGKGLGLLSRELNITESEAEVLKNNILEAVPYIFKLDKYCKMRFSKKSKQRFLLSAGKRKLLPEDGAEYKALNKVVQGSAVDQAIAALIQTWEAGYRILGMVHDSIEISGSDEDALKVKEIMEHCIKLNVPSVAEYTTGATWAEAK